MSILIKGMEMPKDGAYWCEIGVAGDIAVITIHGEDRKSFHLVPVVQCQECKHYEEAKLNVITSHDKVCAYAIDHRFYRDPDDFCSKGERKGGDE